MTEGLESSEIPIFLSILEETVSRMERISTHEGEIDPSKSFAEGEWSIKQILAHLRSCQDVWVYSIYAMLAVDTPHLYPIHPRKLAATMMYEHITFSESFSRFKCAREELLRILRGLPEESWKRGARIEGRQHSVFSQVRRMALHEADHWDQLEDLSR